jgi:hypothetical protein
MENISQENAKLNNNHILNVKYIMTHLGLGDNFICHGIIREYARQNKVVSFAKPQYYDTVFFMYRDNPNIQILPYDDSQAIQFLQQQKINTESYIGIGIYGQNWNTTLTDKSFDQIFYEQSNVLFNLKFDNFNVVRDLNRELELFKKFNIKEKEYIFVHDDPNRGFIINRNLPENISVVRNVPGLTNNLFDYCYLIEKAKEVHVMESSFMFMIDMMKNLECQDMFIHNYARENDVFLTPILQKEWKRVK